MRWTLVTCICSILLHFAVLAKLQTQLLEEKSWTLSPAWEQEKRSFLITEDNWREVVKAVATRSKEVIFSTFTGTEESLRLTSTNHYFWAWQAGVAQNLLLMSQDEASCATLWEAGVPCWVDNFCPRGETLPKSRYNTEEGHYYCKFWWGATLTKHGYTGVFMDNDVILFQDPFKHSDPKLYDFEGLSDYVWQSDRPTPREMLRIPCPLYKTGPDVQKEGSYVYNMGGQYLGHGETLNYSSVFQYSDNKDDSFLSAVTAMVPCMSTGLWFAHAHNATVALLEDMLDWMTVQRPWQWEQAGFQQVLTAHLINVRDSAETLRFRLLPSAKFSNHAVYVSRLQSHRPVEPVAVHPCCIEKPKSEALIEMGLWKPDQWRGKWGAQLKDRYLACLENPDHLTCDVKLNHSSVISHTEHHARLHGQYHHRKWVEERRLQKQSLHDILYG